MIQNRDCLKTCQQNYYKEKQKPQLSHKTPEVFNPKWRWSYH